MIPTDSKKSVARAEYNRAIEAADAEYDRVTADERVELDRDI